MRSPKTNRLPSEEFMKLHREIREASERIVSLTLDSQTALDLADLRAMENQEVGK